MERILTNYQIEWLSNLKLLSEYEKDPSFEKDDLIRKTCNFIENNYPGEEKNILEEFNVLKEKGFINFKASISDLEIETLRLTKSGLDYLVLLEEDFKERSIHDENISKIYQLIYDINENCEKLNKKSLLDKIAQCIGISSDAFSTVSALGSIAQGLIPMIIKTLGN